MPDQILKIWSKDTKQRILQAIAPVVKSAPGLSIEVSNSEHEVPYVHGDKLILCMGGLAQQVLATQPGKVVAKGRTINSLRNQLWPLIPGGECNLQFTYSAGISDIDYNNYVNMLTDVNSAVRAAMTGSSAPQLGVYRYVPDFKELIARIDEIFADTGRPVPVALDLETIGLDPYKLPDPVENHPGARVVTLQFTCEAGKSDVRYINSMEEEVALFDDFEFTMQLGYLLNSPKISLGGANLKFDLHWLWVRARQYCTNFKFDTNLVGSCLDENRSNALDIHAKIYTPLGGYSDEFDNSIDKSRMDLVLPERLLPYAGGDTDACFQVRTAMTQELMADRALTGFYVNILHPAARSFEIVEQGGVLVDRDAYHELESLLNTELLSCVERAKKVVGGRIVAKHQDEEKMGGMNLTKASLLTDFMFSPMGLNLKPLMVTEKEKKPSTALDHLMMFENVPEAKEFISILKDYSSAAKTLSTYVIGFLKHLRSDGRYHPSYYFFVGDRSDADEGGAVTGRLSCKAPAFQTIPKHTKWAKYLRRCYIAPPGMVITEKDYSQGELKVIACIANETTMIDAYRRGLDLHVVTSGRFAGYTYEEMMAMKGMEDSNPELFKLYEDTRQLGKAGNFGLIYGMGAEGFWNYAMTNYGVKDLTLKAATDFRDGFFDTYTALPDYHAEYKLFAKRNGYVRSPLGRMRHLPLINSPKQDVRAKAERQAINSPVQATLSDMLLWANAIEFQKGWFDEAPCFGAIHDAMYNYVPEDKVDVCIKRSLEVMENLPFDKVGWNPQLKFTADAKFGKNLADLSKFKG